VKSCIRHVIATLVHVYNERIVYANLFDVAFSTAARSTRFSTIVAPLTLTERCDADLRLLDRFALVNAGEMTAQIVLARELAIARGHGADVGFDSLHIVRVHVRLQIEGTSETTRTFGASVFLLPVLDFGV